MHHTLGNHNVAFFRPMNDTDVVTPREPAKALDGWWTVRLRASVASRLGQLAAARGVSVATVANEAVTEWLAQQDDAPAHGIPRPQLPGQLSTADELTQRADEVLTNGI